MLEMFSAAVPELVRVTDLRRTGRVHILIAEGQAGWRETDAGCHARSGEVDGLRAAAGVIGDRNRAGLTAGDRGREGDVDGAVGAGGDGSAAGVGLGVRCAGYDAGDVQRGIPRIGQRHRLGRTARVQILIAEAQDGWQKADAGCDTGAAEIDGLWGCRWRCR